MNRISRTASKLGFAALWAVAFVAAFATTVPRPWLLSIIGISLGCLSGHFRSRAIAAGGGARTANALGWLCGIGLMILAMAIAEDMFVGAWAAGFAGYLFADGVYSLPAVRRREQGSHATASDGA